LMADADKEFAYRSDTSFRTIVWRFCESSDIPANIRDRGKVQISCPEDVYKHFRFLFDGQVRERFIVLWLNAANMVHGYEIVSEGILNASLVAPREVFRGAIVSTAAGIILTHNHPSGNPEPSQEDKHITKQIVESGRIIGINVHDHIIFAFDSYTSFAEKGLL
jgi:DNA repair protein RadC